MIVDYHIGLSCSGHDTKCAAPLCSIKREKGCHSHRQWAETVSETFRRMSQRLGMVHELIPAKRRTKTLIESFYAILARECVAWRKFETYAEAYETVVEFINHYNEQWIHSSLGYGTPQEIHEPFLSNSAKLLLL